MPGKSLIVLILLFLCFAILMKCIMAKTPQQPYQRIGSKGSIEFRYYPESIMATVSNPDTSYRGSSGKNFRMLAGYIFGGNEKSQKIAMTAPVHMNSNKDGSSMSFVMPDGYDLNNLPAPSNSAVKLHKTEEEYVAVIRFSGYASDKKIAEKQMELSDILNKEGIEHLNDFRFLGYNAPWDFLFRRNEVVVGISKVTAMKLKQ
jgi:SOUL heme-binding protein